MGSPYVEGKHLIIAIQRSIINILIKTPQDEGEKMINGQRGRMTATDK